MSSHVRIAALLACAALLTTLSAAANVFSVSGNQVLYNGVPFKVIGLRLSNALISDAEVDELIAQLPVYRSYGVNTVSVFIMGSRFGDLKGYRPDSSIDPAVAERLHRVLDATDAEGMALLVGCLYWGTSAAKEDLGGWSQADADKAVANTVQLLADSGHRHVFVDPDNEGMANKAKGWSIGSMIAAGKTVSTEIPIGFNAKGTLPPNADLLMHFSGKDGVRPWIQSEGSAGNIPDPPGGGYWGVYSKETHNDLGDGWLNYSRIGRYTSDMKSSQISAAHNSIDSQNGYMMASTWLQAGPGAGINGPFMHPGGDSNISNVNSNIDDLHPDAGVLWWLKAMKQTYGPWVPPGAGNIAPSVDAGNDQSAIIGTPVQLNGTVSDDGQPDGTLTTTWSGTGAILADATAGDTTVTFTSVGSYTLTLTANDGELSSSDTVVITVVPEPVPGTVQINFQPADSAVPAGYLVDDGAVFGDRGNGQVYGWVGSANDKARERDVDSDQRLDTLNHFENSGVRSWQIALANGNYDLVVQCGDPKFTDSTNSLSIEGVVVSDPDGPDNFDQHILSVSISDGTLDITQDASGNNAKIAYVHIVPSGGGAARGVTIAVSPLPAGVWSVLRDDAADSDLLDGDGASFTGLDAGIDHMFAFIEVPAGGG